VHGALRRFQGGVSLSVYELSFFQALLHFQNLVDLALGSFLGQLNLDSQRVSLHGPLGRLQLQVTLQLDALFLHSTMLNLQRALRLIRLHLGLLSKFENL